MGILLDEAQVLDRDIEPVVIAEGDLDELRAAAVDRKLDQAAEDAYAVIGVDDVIVRLKVLEMGDKGLPGVTAEQDLLFRENVPLGKVGDLLGAVTEALLEPSQK